MKHLLVILLVISLVSGVAAIIHSISVNRIFKSQLLRVYILFMCFAYMIGIFNFTMHYVTTNVNFLSAWDTYLFVIIMGFLGFTLTLIEVYLFSIVIWNLIEKSVPNWYKILYSIIAAAWLLSFSYGVLKFFENDSKTILGYQSYITALIMMIILFSLSIYLLYAAIKLPPSNKKKVLLNLSYFFLFLSLIDFCGFLFPGIIHNIMIASTNIIMSVSTLLFLRRFLNHYFENSPLKPNYYSSLEHFADKYYISQREKEIIEMILNGLSNKEIEQKAFISHSTVKNHIYHIFQKAGVKSRSQLINTVLNCPSN